MKAYQQKLGVASKILPLESFLSEDKDITVHPHWHTEIEILYVLELSLIHILTGRGLSTDVIESSILAYLNGINKLVEKW